MDTGDDIIDEGMLSNTAMFDDKLSGARFCVGEKIMSIMQLLKTPCASYGNYGAAGSQIQVFPFAAETVNTAQPAVEPEWYDYFISSFAMSRGGMRLKVVDNTSVVTFVHVTLYDQNLSTATPIQRQMIGDPSIYHSFSSTDYATYPTQYFNMSKNPVEISVPQYHRLHSRVNSELMFGTGLGTAYYSSNLSTSAPNTFVNIQSVNGQNWNPGNMTLLRSVADDFQLGYFVGVPPMRVA